MPTEEKEINIKGQVDHRLIDTAADTTANANNCSQASDQQCGRPQRVIKESLPGWQRAWCIRETDNVGWGHCIQ